VIRVRGANRELFSEVGAVTLIDNRIDPQTGTLKCWATFPNADELLLPGGIVEVVISKKSAVKVPAIKVTALLTTKNGHAVYVVGADNKVSARPVEVGEIIGDLQTITKGLAVGETVVIDGTHKTRDGGTIVPHWANGEK
jgi:RND family efflux transporter MFP subunit